ncbi:MAG: response regulator transcription factor [Chloroflexota bacterium]
MVINWARLLGPPRIAAHTGDPRLASLVERAVAEQRAVVVVIEAQGRTIGEQPPHLVIVDLQGPHAIETLSSYTRDEARIPVIAVVRTDGELQPRLAAFANGADDVVSLPIAPTELGARVRALLRRTYGERAAYIPTVTVGDLEIDVIENRVRSDGKDRDLTSTEQAILFVLASSPGQVLSRDQIRRTVWGATGAPPSNIVDRHVRSLRSKLGDSWRQPRYIATVRQQGYRLLAP